MEVPVSIPDVPCDAPPEAISVYESLRVRRMGRRDLLLEAASVKHKLAHSPHNPLCEISIRAYMKQRQYANTIEAEDDGLANVTAPVR